MKLNIYFLIVFSAWIFLFFSACKDITINIPGLPSPTPQVSPTPVSTPTASPSPTLAPTSTPSPTPTPTVTPSPTPQTTAKLQIGVNLASPSYWDAEAMYADVTNYTSGWWADNVGVATNSIQPFSVTADNYPTTNAQVLSNFVGYPVGLYAVSFDHNANTKVVIGWNETFKTAPQNQLDSPPDSAGLIHTTYKLQLNGDTPIMIYVHRVDPTKPNFMIKNLHILAPDASGSFRSPFLTKVAPFNPIRMMGMNNTNDAKTAVGQTPDCPAKEWNQRTLTSSFSRSNNTQQFMAPARDGATYEEEIELANTLKKDIWINIPDCASDDFITQLATLFHNKLNSTSKLYVEYSNETWNTGFGQWGNIRDVTKGIPALQKYDDVTRVQIYTAVRLMQTMTIFQKVFSDRKVQLQGVLAGQAANLWTISVGLDYLKSTFGDPKLWIQALAGAPYFGPMSADWASYDTPMQNHFHSSQAYLKSKLQSDLVKMENDMLASKDALFASLTQYENTFVHQWIKDGKALQDKYGIPYIAYEGGQSLVAAFGSLPNQTVIDAYGVTKTGQTVYYQFDPMHAAEIDPRMAALYEDLLTTWKNTFGSQPFVHLGFVSAPDNWGFWGIWENLKDSSTKGDEILKLLKTP